MNLPGTEGQRASVEVWKVGGRLTGLQVQILKYVDLSFNTNLQKHRSKTFLMKVKPTALVGPE